MSPYEDPAVSAGEIAEYLYSLNPQLPPMSRYQQRFCKLFDQGQEGQLLLQCIEDEQQKPALSITTVSVNGTRMTVAPSFTSQEARDKAFLEYDESKALFQFHAMQQTLAEAEGR